MNKFYYFILVILLIGCSRSGSGSLAGMTNSTSVQWPTYKGNFSRNPAYGAPLNLPLKELWHEDASRAIGSTPLVVNNKLIVHARDRRVVALDLQSGKRLWRETYKGGFSASSAIIVDNLLVYGSQRPDGRLIIFNPENRKDILIENLGPSTATPIFNDGKILYFNQYGRVIKFDQSKETSDWETPLEGRLEYTPVIIGNRLVVSTIEKNLYSIDLSDGKIVKQRKLDDLILGDLAADEENVYLNLGDGRTMKLSPENLDTLWSVKHAGSFFSGPMYNDNHVYVCSRPGEIIKLSAADGHEIWRQALGGPTVSPPVVDGNTAFATTKDGLVVAVNDRTGSIVWQDSLREGISATPLIYDGSLYVCTDRGKVHAFRSE